MQREPLNRERIIDAAAAVADRGGMSAVSMRNVGKELGVEAMSLYHHVAGKEALLDALVDWIFARVELPAADDPWRGGMIRRAASARRVLTAHPWGLGLIESRSTPGPALLGHHNAVIGCLRRGGFSIMLASHAFSAIDAYVYGFALTEQTLPFDPAAATSAGDFAAEFAGMIEAYPYLAELVGALTSGRDYVFSDEFDDGLTMILDQLELRLAAEVADGGSAPVAAPTA